MIKHFYNAAMMCACLALTGCGVGNISVSSAPEPSATGAFPDLVKVGMAPYQNFTDVPLLAPTVVPQTTGLFKTVTANGKTVLNNGYQINFFSNKQNIAIYTGHVESPALPEEQVLVATGYGAYQPSKNYTYHAGKVTLADGISGSTYYLKLTNNIPGYAKGGTQVIWQMDGYHCEVESLSFSIQRDVSAANAMIKLIQSSSLPKPYTTGTVVLALNSRWSWTSQQQAVVAWDYKNGGKAGVYRVTTRPPCKRPIDTAVAMASSSRIYDEK